MRRRGAQPLVENGIVVGTGSDKYEQKNPLVRWALRQFDRALAELAGQIAPERVLEVGCGEGHVTELLLRHTPALVTALDISERVLEIARDRVGSERTEFRRQSIYDLDPERDRAPLVVCCEVLEHLQEPAAGLERLARVAAPYALLSVPREPLFRTLNVLRGAHLKALGNSPGHVQHWSKQAFVRFVAREFELLEVRTPVPWTVLLGRSRRTG